FFEQLPALGHVPGHADHALRPAAVVAHQLAVRRVMPYCPADDRAAILELERLTGLDAALPGTHEPLAVLGMHDRLRDTFIVGARHAEELTGVAREARAAFGHAPVPADRARGLQCYQQAPFTASQLFLQLDRVGHVADRRDDRAQIGIVQAIDRGV